MSPGTPITITLAVQWPTVRSHLDHEGNIISFYEIFCHGQILDIIREKLVIIIVNYFTATID